MSMFGWGRIVCAAAGAIGLSIAGACGGGAVGADAADRGVALGDLGGETVEPTPVVLSEEAWSFAGREGVVVRTPNYRVFTTEGDERVRERLVVTLEHALAQYRTAAGTLPRPASRLDVYLMDNRDQWEVLTKRLMGRGGEDLGHIERGGYAARGIGVYYDLGLSDTLRIAAHEGWHQYTQRVFRDPLPVWLEEGMATYMEGHRWVGVGPRFSAWANVERFDRLREAAGADRVIPLSRLVEMRPQDEMARGGDGALDFYAHAWAAVHFLREGEDGRFREPLETLLDDAAAGRMRVVVESSHGRAVARRAIGARVGDEVFEAYFGTSPEALDASFERFVREVVRTGGREAIVAGRSPITG